MHKGIASGWPARLALLVAMIIPFCAAAGDDTRALTLAGIAAYNRGDYVTAFQRLKSAADMGDSDAEVNLGYMYARGQTVPVNQAEAMRLYRLSAAKGNGEGMNAIAYKYTYGTGVPIDLKAAVFWYCQAIAIGNPRAMTNLGLFHAQGAGVSYDLGEARSLWRQAAALGHANAMYDLGVSLVASPETDRDSVEGKNWIVRAAELGQPLAIGWLRARGYEGTLPEPVDTTGMMALAPPNATGSAAECVIS